MPWFGDINIPVISDVDTSIDVNTIDTNFVDEDPRTYRLHSRLESGNYSVFLTENLHPRNETLEEQRDSVLSMVDRHGSEFPVEYEGGRGYIVVDTVNLIQSPSEIVDSAELTLTFLPEDNYTSGWIKWTKDSSDYNIPNYNFFPISSEVDVIVDGEWKDPSVSINTFGGEVDLYKYSGKSKIRTYISDFSSYFERTSPCRVFSNGNRIYSKLKEIRSFEIENSIISISSSNNNLDISYYDGSWEEVASVSYNHNVAYPERNVNDWVKCRSDTSESVSLSRGSHTSSIEVKDRDAFNVSFDVDSVVSQDDYYMSVLSQDGYKIILVREKDIGTFGTTPTSAFLTGINKRDIKMHVGVVPSELSSEQVAVSALSEGESKRTFLEE